VNENIGPGVSGVEDGRDIREREVKAGDRIVSPVDPDARRGMKWESRPFTGYKVHTCTTDRDVITRVEVTEGNRDDGKQMTDGMRKDHGLRPRKIRGDAAYGTGENYRGMEARGIRLAAPLSGGGGGVHHELFGKEMFMYNPGKGVVICPAGKESKRKERIECRNAFRHYFAEADCKGCPLKCICTKGRLRSLSVSDYDPEYKKMRAYLKTEEAKEDRRRRFERERVYGEMKNRHGMGRARHWGLAKMKIQAYLTAMVVNIKRLVRWMQERSRVMVNPA